MIGLGTSLVLVASTVALVALLDPLGRWPLGLVNLVAFSVVILAGWQVQKRRLAPAAPPRWEWGWPGLGVQEQVPVVVGVLLTALGGSVVLGSLGDLLARWWPIPEALLRAFDRLAPGTAPLEVLFPLMAIAALTEEGLFRGLMLPSLALRHGTPTAVLVTALLFGAIHLNPWQGVPAFVAGLYLGCLRLRTGGLALPMLAHGLFNGFPLLLGLIGVLVPGYNDPAALRMTGGVPTEVLIGGFVVLPVGLALSVRIRLFRPPMF